MFVDQEKMIVEIADSLDCSEVVYLHKVTKNILIHPLIDEYNSHEFDYLLREVQDIVDLAPEDYIQFNPPDSKTSYNIMVAFAEHITDAAASEALRISLAGRKPFRVFRNAVEDADLLDQWYDFKTAYLQLIVRDQLESE